MPSQEQNKSSNDRIQHRQQSTDRQGTRQQSASTMDATATDFLPQLQPWSAWQGDFGHNFPYSMPFEAEQSMSFTESYSNAGVEQLTGPSQPGISNPNPNYSLSPSITIDMPAPEPLQQYQNFPRYSSFSEPLTELSSSAHLQAGFQVPPTQPPSSLQPVASPEMLSPRDSVDVDEGHESSSSQQGTDYRCWDHGCAGRSFSSASNFRRHRQEQAGLRRKWSCTHCGRVFTRSTARNNHMRDGHCLQRKNSGQARRKSQSP